MPDDSSAASESPKRIVIIGGGISGLSAATHLARRAGDDPPREVILLEREQEVGGKARTHVDGEWRVETGPTAFLGDSATLDTLITDTGLDPRRVAANESAKRRYLVRKGKPREVPPHPLRFAFSGLLSPLGILRIAREPWIRRADAETARRESVWEFAARRLGPQAADRLIAPMVLGIYAGDPKHLSLPAAFPKLAALERDHGSLIRGMIAKKRAAKRAGRVLEGGPAGPAGGMHSFVSGLEELPRALAATPGVAVRRGAVVEGIARIGGEGDTRRWRIAVAGESPLEADAVICAGEAWAMAPLLEGTAPEISETLREIPYPPVAVVALGFTSDAAARVPHGFGALVPRGQGFRMLGTLWDSRIFSGRSPDDHVLVRAIYGGSVDPEAGDFDEETLIALAREELGRLLGVVEPPVFHHVVQWPKAIPQYDLGHLDRVTKIRARLDELPGLEWAGNSLDGVAFGKAAESGVRAAEAVERSLGSREAAGR